MSADRIGLQTAPYSLVFPVGSVANSKRYYHLETHGLMSAAGLLEEVMRRSNLDPASHRETIDFWKSLEDTGRAGLSAGAIQVKNQVSAGSPPDAKAYFRPMRLEGLGLRLAARTLARGCAGVSDGAEARIYSEILRRDALAPISYLSVSLRKGLEIETYHDRVSDGPAFDAEAGRRLGRELSETHAIGDRAGLLIEIASRSGFECIHISCDLWPKASGLTVVLAPGLGVKADRKGFESVAHDLMGLCGSTAPWHPGLEMWSGQAGLQPSLIAVKITAEEGVLHSVLFEEVDPDFAHYL